MQDLISATRGLAKFGLFAILGLLVGIPPHTTDIDSRMAGGESRELELSSSLDQRFDSALEAVCPNARLVQGFDTIRPLTVVLRNGADHGVKAWVVRWRITEQSNRRHGRVSVAWSSGGVKALSGGAITLAPGESRLVLPGVNLTSDQCRRSNFSNMIAALSKGPLGTEARDAVKIEVWVDSAVYDDGLFTGPDEYEFYDRYRNQRQGEQDEAVAILALIRTNEPDDQLSIRLQADIEAGREVEANDEMISLTAVKGREARVLLDVLRQRGRNAVNEVCLRLASETLGILRRN